MKKIFIEYRREDTQETCGRIYDRLVASFGQDAIFKDVDSIPPGIDFKQHIQDVIPQCAVQLVVIGPMWLEVRDASGQRRLDDPNDNVRLEIEAALQHGVKMLPILVKNATMPREEEMPEPLSQLARVNAVSVRYDPDFDTDMRKVISWISQLLSSAPPAPQPSVLPATGQQWAPPGAAPSQPLAPGYPAPAIPPATPSMPPAPGIPSAHPASMSRMPPAGPSWPSPPPQPVAPFGAPVPPSRPLAPGYAPAMPSTPFVAAPVTMPPGMMGPTPAGQAGIGGGAAIAGLVLGILSLIGMLFLAVLGIILGIVGLIFSVIGRRSPARRGMAMAGLICSIVGLVGSSVYLLVVVSMIRH